MGLLEAPNSIVKSGLDPIAALIQNPFRRKVKGATTKPDFPEGFQFVEIIQGVESTAALGKVTLLGNMLPMQPFTFGGSQRVVKDYYPGHSEPTVQILGPKETDITVKGKLKDKRYRDPGLAGVSTEIQEQIDAIRIRGNVLRITLGEWQRYGFLEETNFKMNTLREVEYELKFSIIGFNAPQNCKFTEVGVKPPVAIKGELIAAALAFQSTYSSMPADMPASLADIMNDAIGEVAALIGTVTSFADKILTTAEDVNKSVNRAIGLAKNARASVSRYQRRVGSLVYSLASVAPGLLPAARTISGYNNINHITKSMSATHQLQDLLSRLEAQFKALNVTVPMARHRVRTGDTLQKLAIKYYNDANLWKKIFDHNKLSVTALTVGKVLEIPKL